MMSSSLPDDDGCSGDAVGTTGLIDDSVAGPTTEGWKGNREGGV